MVRNKLKKEELLFRFTIGKNNRLCLRNKKSAPVRALSYRGNYNMNLNEFKSKFFKKANGCAFNLIPLFQDYSVYFDAPDGGRIDVTASYSRGKFSGLHFGFIDRNGNTVSHATVNGNGVSLSGWLEAVEDSGVLND